MPYTAPILRFIELFRVLGGGFADRRSGAKPSRSQRTKMNLLVSAARATPALPNSTPAQPGVGVQTPLVASEPATSALGIAGPHTGWT